MKVEIGELTEISLRLIPENEKEISILENILRFGRIDSFNHADSSLKILFFRNQEDYDFYIEYRKWDLAGRHPPSPKAPDEHAYTNTP